MNGYPRFLSENILAAPADLLISSERLGEVGGALAVVLGDGVCHAQGDYSGSLATEQFVVEIDSVAAGADVGQATYRWKGGARASFEGNQQTTHDALIELRDGVSIRFDGEGFKAGDIWYIEANRENGRAALFQTDPAELWQSTQCALVTMSADLGVAQNVLAMILADHNLSGAATAILKASGIAHEPVWEFDPGGGVLESSEGVAGSNGRATPRTYIDGGVLKYASAGESCFEDGKLSISPAVTNLLSHTEDFSSWTTTNFTAASGATAPDGAPAADTCAENNGSGSKEASQNVTLASDNTLYVLSVFAKTNGRDFRLQVKNKAGNYKSTFFDLSAGTVGSDTSDASGIIALSGGWDLCWIAVDSGSGASTPYCKINLADGETLSYSGDGSSGLYLWGAQLTASPVPLAYAPNDAGNANDMGGVSAADAVSFTMTAEVMALLSSGGEGTLAVEWTPGFDAADLASNTSYGIISAQDAADSLLYMRRDATNFRVCSHDGSDFSRAYFGAVKGVNYILVARWSDATNTLIVSYDATDGDEKSYDGAFTLGTDLNIGYSPSYPFKIGRVKFFSPWLDAEPRAVMDPWDYPDYSQALSITSPHLVQFLDESYRYWRLEIADPTNPNGIIKASQFYLGGYTQLSRRMNQGATYGPVASRTDHKVAGRLVGASVGAVSYEWRLPFDRLGQADRAALLAVFHRAHDEANGLLRPIWFIPDHLDISGLLWGFLPAKLPFVLSNPGRAAVSAGFVEHA